MRTTFSFRTMITVTAFAAAAVSLMAPAHAAESTDLYTRDSQVGQGTAPVDEDRTTDGWLHSYIGTQNREPAKTELGSIREDSTTDGWLHSYIGTQNREPAKTELGSISDSLTDSGTDWVVLAGGLLLAFLMGISGTLAVEYFMHTRHRTA